LKISFLIFFSTGVEQSLNSCGHLFIIKRGLIFFFIFYEFRIVFHLLDIINTFNEKVNKEKTLFHEFFHETNSLSILLLVQRPCFFIKLNEKHEYYHLHISKKVSRTRKKEYHSMKNKQNSYNKTSSYI
jgi:hypothetical protein